MKITIPSIIKLQHFPLEKKNIFEFLAEKINYPAFAKENNIQGQLYLSFIIDENATISDIRINKGVHIILDKETVRVLRLMKFSNPCLLNNKPIKVQFKLYFYLPIRQLITQKFR